MPALILRVAALMLACSVPSGSPLAGGPSLPPTAQPGPAAASPVTVDASRPAVPPPEVLLLMVRNALAALNHANLTGNYTVLHGLGSPSLQAQNSAAQLGIVFTALRTQGVDLAPTLVLTPQLSETPALSADGVLRLAGLFPTRPLQIAFIILYRSVNARWTIDGLSVTAGPPGTAPPNTAEPNAATPPAATPQARIPEQGSPEQGLKKK